MPATVTAARSDSLGRIPIRALSPQQPENRWPAKAYVGEVVPFEATVFREGHGAAARRAGAHRPRRRRVTLHPMQLIAPGTDRWRAEVQLDRAGRAGAGASAPRATTGPPGCTTPRSRSRRGRMSSSSSPMGAELLARLPRSRCSPRPAPPSWTRELTPAARLTVAHDPRLTARDRRASRAVAAHRISRALTLRVERTRAGGRRLVRVLPPLGGRQAGARTAPGPAAPSAPPPAPARRRGDGLRRGLPAADPPDRARVPQGTEQHARRRPERPGQPVGDRLGRGRPRRHPPRPRHRRRLHVLPRRRPRSTASRSRSTSRCSARPTTRG